MPQPWTLFFTLSCHPAIPYYAYTLNPICCIKMEIALSYSLAHLAVPYGGRQDARLEPKYIQRWETVSTSSSRQEALLAKRPPSGLSAPAAAGPRLPSTPSDTTPAVPLIT
jgi:hypothetical protein